jgi:exopolysaccharide production protein ExoQ
MDSPATSAQRRATIVLGGVLLALAPVAVYARLGTVVLLVLTLIAQPCFDGTMARLKRFSRNALTVACALLVLWAAVTLLWTPAPDAIYVLRTAIVPVMGLLFVAAIQGLPPPGSQRLARLAMAGGLALLALLSLEVFAQGALLRLVVPDQGPLLPGQKRYIIDVAARGAAVLAPLTLIYAYLIYARTGRAALAVLFVAASLVVCKVSTMDAAWVAVAMGCLAFGAALIAPRLALIGVFGGLIAYAVLAPVISTFILTTDVLPMTGPMDMELIGTQTRIGIWQEASRLIAQHPLLGHGFDSARELAKTAPTIAGTPYPSLPLHTHNAFLQIWLELGAIGIAIVLAMLALAARALWPLTSPSMTVRPLHLAVTLGTIASTAAVALISFGVWQHWWLATWMFAAGLLHLALRQPLSSQAVARV